MTERDTLADLRAWRDEFARSHGYDMAAMVASLRALEQSSGVKLVRGTPRQPMSTGRPIEGTIKPAMPAQLPLVG